MHKNGFVIIVEVSGHDSAWYTDDYRLVKMSVKNNLQCLFGLIGGANVGWM